jgi:hypothetical protein
VGSILFCYPRPLWPQKSNVCVGYGIIRLKELVCLGPKVIPLSGASCTMIGGITYREICIVIYFANTAVKCVILIFYVYVLIRNEEEIRLKGILILMIGLISLKLIFSKIDLEKTFCNLFGLGNTFDSYRN